MDNKYIYFNSRDSFFRIEIALIAYFEADKNYTNLYLTNGQKLVFTFGLAVMKQYLEERLKGNAKRFVRIGKSYIVNILLVYQINVPKQHLVLYDNLFDRQFTLAVSREGLKNLRLLFIKND